MLIDSSICSRVACHSSICPSHSRTRLGQRIFISSFFATQPSCSAQSEGVQMETPSQDDRFLRFPFWLHRVRLAVADLQPCYPGARIGQHKRLKVSPIPEQLPSSLSKSRVDLIEHLQRDQCSYTRPTGSFPSYL